ncbi:hypothetical protein GCM10027175_09360 [Hymenobacter latericoloratus]
MSEAYIPAAMRRQVAERAGYCCEYCRLAEADMFLGCHIDHVISEKHGGLTQPDNLAYACVFCNLHKGSDIASLTGAGELVALYNPRRQRWQEHFRLQGALILPTTTVGEVTVRLLQFNHPDRLLEREALLVVNRYPPA